eukprot:scpid100943/ scgid25131/ 
MVNEGNSISSIGTGTVSVRRSKSASVYSSGGSSFQSSNPGSHGHHKRTSSIRSNSLHSILVQAPKSRSDSKQHISKKAFVWRLRHSFRRGSSGGVGGGGGTMLED